jgi:hypothetical protein
VPNELRNSLGETGTMEAVSSQDFVDKHLHISEGGCLGICAKFMAEFKNPFVTEQDYLEAAQWVQSGPEPQERVDLLAEAAGLRKVETYEGQLLTDEIYLTHFLGRAIAKPTSFTVFGFVNTARNHGHALLLYKWGDDWYLFDPNFGHAKWPHAGALMLGLKRLLRSAAYRRYGPFYRFKAIRYE